MSQFISIPNQEVIWKSFQRIPQTKNIPIMELHKWFQSTMGIVYSSIQANRIQNINQQQLLEYNREVVKMLMVHVKEYNNQLQPLSTPLPPQPPSQTQPNPIQPVQSDTSMQTQFYETPEERTQRIFQEKQKQFQNFHQKPDLPNPKDLFQEPTNDDTDNAIQNVDALIEEYQKQREQDVPQYVPIPQPNATTTTTATTVEGNTVTTSTNNNPSNQELQRAIQQLESRVQILEQTLANLGTFDSVSDQTRPL